jgi:uncharacterized protein YjiS (DUF1127 family)
MLKFKKFIEEKWLTRYLKYLATWRKHRQIIKELNMLTDRELRDIGINRSDINHLIWQEEDEAISGKGKSK